MRKEKEFFYKLYKKSTDEYISRGGKGNKIWMYPDGPVSYLTSSLLYDRRSSDEQLKGANDYEVHTFRIEKVDSVNIGQMVAQKKAQEVAIKGAKALIETRKRAIETIFLKEMDVRLGYDSIMVMYRKGKLSAGVMTALKENVESINAIKKQFKIK